MSWLQHAGGKKTDCPACTVKSGASEAKVEMTKDAAVTLRVEVGRRERGHQAQGDPWLFLPVEILPAARSLSFFIADHAGCQGFLPPPPRGHFPCDSGSDCNTEPGSV